MSRLLRDLYRTVAEQEREIELLRGFARERLVQEVEWFSQELFLCAWHSGIEVVLWRVCFVDAFPPKRIEGAVGTFDDRSVWYEELVDRLRGLRELALLTQSWVGWSGSKATWITAEEWQSVSGQMFPRKDGSVKPLPVSWLVFVARAGLSADAEHEIMMAMHQDPPLREDVALLAHHLDKCEAISVRRVMILALARLRERSYVRRALVGDEVALQEAALNGLGYWPDPILLPELRALAERDDRPQWLRDHARDLAEGLEE